MQDANQDLLASFQEVITDELFIGSSGDDLPLEMANKWWITLSHEQCQSLTTSDLLTLFERIIENRQQQLDRANADHGMIFYLWFDEQAFQLRFNLISDSHEHLPFRAHYHVLSTPEPIFERYLRFSYHESLPWSELQEVSEEWNDAEEKEYVFDVYQLKLAPQKPILLW